MDKDGQYRSRVRDLFGVQLEVTSLLLNTELLKLRGLQAEWEFMRNNHQSNFGVRQRIKEEEEFHIICAISRIQAQVEQLEREYTSHALGALKSAPSRQLGKNNRSQPALGVKYLPKLRPSIFGIVNSSSPVASNSDASSTSTSTYSHPHKIAAGSSSGSSRVIPLNGIKSPPNGFSSASSSSCCASVTGAGSSPVVSSPSPSHYPHPILFTDQPGGSVSKSISDDQTLRYEDSSLLSGTLDALVEKLAPTETHYADRAFIFAFLLSSRLYIRPHQLLGRIFATSFPPPPSGSTSASITSQNHHPNNRDGGESAKETKVVSRLVQLLGEWAELFAYDFRDERMMAHVRTITQKCVAVDPSIRREVSQLLTTLLARLTALERYEDFLHKTNVQASLGDPATAPSILSICPNPTMLAQQLTHIELERLSHIGPEEFVQAFAKDNAQVDSKYKDIKKTRNLESYVQWFNRLSHFVATEICKVQKKKSRIRVVEYWIEAARESFNIGNFNSLMAIIAGLNMSPVARLKKTWSKVSTAQLSILEHQMDPTANFSSYRSTLKAAVWRSVGATDERQRIVIPFFSLLVKDLYFLNEGCASKLPNGHINFEKFWQFAKQVTEVITWQSINCSFPKVPTVLSSLHTAPVFNENALCLASYECESADNASEKERLKLLRRQESTNNIEITDCLPKTKHFRKNVKKSNGSVSSSTGESCEKNSKAS